MNREIVNALGSDKDWYIIDLLGQVHQHRVMYLRSLQKFGEISRKFCILIWFNRCIENQIFLGDSFFSNADMHILAYFID